MIRLLDVNVLIASCDPAHPHAVAAGRYFAAGLGRSGWATCPLVENGFLRILGARHCPGGPGSPDAARQLLSGLLAAFGHQFWPDDVSLIKRSLFPALPGAAEMTDVYLVVLAVRHQAGFATFDAGINASLVQGGAQALHAIEANERLDAAVVRAAALIEQPNEKKPPARAGGVGVDAGPVRWPGWRRCRRSRTGA